MRLLAMSLIATGYLCCNAHVIKYTYDDSGNRIKREIVINMATNNESMDKTPTKAHCDMFLVKK